jgi:hypothetical protein
MTKNGEKADDDVDELEALESEAKEFTKASPALRCPLLRSYTDYSMLIGC